MVLQKLIGKEPQITRRLFDGSWDLMGCIKREADTRTTEQLLENIDYYALRCPEVAQFKNELKSMNPKFMGLVSDICELANHNELLNASINIKKPIPNGKSLFQILMEKLPKASKENPESLELMQAVIDNTDPIAAKYAMSSLSSLLECKDVAPHIKATVPLVHDIAESTLQGGYTMDYSKEKNFVNGLFGFMHPRVILEKLQLFPQILRAAEKSKATCEIDAFPFLTNATPMKRIVENLEAFKKLEGNMEGKTINLTDFLENNVNLT